MAIGSRMVVLYRLRLSAAPVIRMETHSEKAISTGVAFREKPKSFSHKLQKSTTFCKLAKNKRAFERYFISYQTPFYLFIIMAHPVCIPVYLKYHNSMPYKFGQDDSG